MSSRESKPVFPFDRPRCHQCNLKAGGEIPKNPGAITVSAGTCGDCGKAATIVPASDYRWPKLKKDPYVWD